VRAATGLDGRTFLSVSTAVGGCPTKANETAVFVLRGTHWARFRANATWAATGPDGQVALLRPDSTLLLDGAVVAQGVALAAWGTTTSD
jgi:hypothetical protein